MFITSKNAIVEAISKDLVETLYIKFPISKREKDIVKLAEKKKVIIKNVDKNEMEKIVGKVYSIAADIKENAEIGLENFLEKAFEKRENTLILMLPAL